MSRGIWGTWSARRVRGTLAGGFRNGSWYAFWWTSVQRALTRGRGRVHMCPPPQRSAPLSSSISSRPRPPSLWAAFIIFACLFGKVLFLLRLVWLFNIQDIEHLLVLKMIIAGSVYQMLLLVGLNIVKVGLWLYALVWSWMGLANLAHLLFPFIFFYCLSSATPCFLITFLTLSSFLSQSSSVPPVAAPCLRSCRVRSSSWPYRARSVDADASCRCSGGWRGLWNSRARCFIRYFSHSLFSISSSNSLKTYCF